MCTDKLKGWQRCFITRLELGESNILIVNAAFCALSKICETKVENVSTQVKRYNGQIA